MSRWITDFEEMVALSKQKRREKDLEEELDDMAASDEAHYKHRKHLEMIEKDRAYY